MKLKFQNMNKIFPFLIFLFAINLLFSCSNKKNSNKNNTSEDKAKTQEIYSQYESELNKFNEFLQAKDFNSAYSFFSDTLKQVFNKQNLEQKFNDLQTHDSTAIYYFQITKGNFGEIYTFYLRVFEKTELLFYEKLSFYLENSKYKIIDLDFSQRIFYNPKMANDSVSDLNKFLQTIYESLITDNVSLAYSCIDKDVKAKLDFQSFEKVFSELKPLTRGQKSFSVKSLWQDNIQSIPIIYMIVEITNFNEDKFLDKISVSDRNSEFFILEMDRDSFERADLVQIERLNDADLNNYAIFASDFYELLKSSNFTKLMSLIDKSVFLNTNYEQIKNSFIARQDYYGRPKTIKNTLVKSYSLGTKTLVEFNFDVQNDKGIISYEKVQVIKTTNSKYYIFSYDFKSERF